MQAKIAFDFSFLNYKQGDCYDISCILQIYEEISTISIIPISD